LLLGVPSRLVVEALGAAGSPASLVGLLCAIWWTWDKLRGPSDGRTGGHRPVRRWAGIVLLAFVASYFVAATRPINPGELSTADSGMLSLIGWLGILLLANDGIDDPARLRALLRRVAVAGGLVGLLGLVQFITGRAFVDLIQIPGLTSNTPVFGVAQRNGFNRPAGTSIHAIEFSVVITMILPLAVTLATQRDGRTILARWWPVAAMVAVIPLAISRSAIVGAVVGFLVLLPSLSGRVRGLVLIGATAAAIVTFITVPGLLGSLGRLFVNIDSDGSSRSRTDSYGLVGEYFLHSPLFGRGYSTFLPAHRILDNQYLLLLMDVGLIGLLAVLGLLASGAAAGVGARRTAMNPRIAELGQSVAASIAVGAVGLALFDAFSFPMAVGLLMLSIGLAGNLRHHVDSRFAVAHMFSNLERLR
jgi:O-antigen ligase